MLVVVVVRGGVELGDALRALEVRRVAPGHAQVFPSLPESKNISLPVADDDADRALRAVLVRGGGELPDRVVHHRLDGRARVLNGSRDHLSFFFLSSRLFREYLQILLISFAVFLSKYHGAKFKTERRLEKSKEARSNHVELERVLQQLHDVLVEQVSDVEALKVYYLTVFFFAFLVVLSLYLAVTSVGACETG